MSERVKFVAAYLTNDGSFSELCERFEISRKTGYKWVERYSAGGVANLIDRSRAPACHAHRVSDEVVNAVVALRRKHPRWGPLKLLVVLQRQEPSLQLPAASTVGEIIRRHGLVGYRRRRHRSSPYAEALRSYASPNAIWCADFKGHFPVSGKRCHPLTISDGFSRFLIRCHALKRPMSEPSRRVFESAFLEYGLPDIIRTDNGAPFSTLAPGGLSRLAVWWLRLGIRHERIKPGRPDQNGRHERMHRTLKAETAKPPRSSFPAQQRAFDDFMHEYNYVRPHEALEQATPASVYTLSPRALPKNLPEPEYPSYFRTERVYPNGVISLAGTQWYISHCLSNEMIGLEEVEDGRWKVYFADVELGTLDAQRAKERDGRNFSVLVRNDGQDTSRRRRRHAR
jgi:putative transposase